MATATLLAGSKGSRYVDRQELDGIEAPPATETWYPIAHRDVVSTVIQSTRARGFQVEEEKHSLSRGNARYFGVLRLTATLVPGCRLAMAIANSVDRSMPMRASAGNVVLACQNLSMRSDLMSEVRRKHTKRGMEDFTRLITEATGKLEHFQQAETARIERFKTFFISDTVAKSSKLMTDDYRAYKSIAIIQDHAHSTVNHSRNQWRKGDTHTNTIEGFWSQLKRSLDGTHHVISPKYLPLYLSEFQFRYNHGRSSVEHLFSFLLSRVALPHV